MKYFVAIFLLASILCSSAKATFNFADFFFGSGQHKDSDTSKRSSAPDVSPDTEILSSNSNASLPVNSKIDPTAINSTFDQEFVDSYSSNTSESSESPENYSVSYETEEYSNDRTNHTVKKQLSNSAYSYSYSSSATSRISTSIEQDSWNSEPTSGSAVSSATDFNLTANSDEVEEVVLGTTQDPAIPDEKGLFQKSIEWVEDAYTLSILIPVAAGILFATTCIMTIAICGCLRRCCRRRRLRRKILPDSVKNLRASDRKRLLGDCSSDEEF